MTDGVCDYDRLLRHACSEGTIPSSTDHAIGTSSDLLGSKNGGRGGTRSRRDARIGSLAVRETVTRYERAVSLACLLTWSYFE